MPMVLIDCDSMSVLHYKWNNYVITNLCPPWLLETKLKGLKHDLECKISLQMLYNM